MFLQLGQYKFDTTKTPTSFNFSEGQKLVTQDRAGSTPMIYNNGRELFEISFDFRLGIPFEKKPEQIIFELLALKRDGEALVLLQGNVKEYVEI
jgi:hypothetical protein